MRSRTLLALVAWLPAWAAPAGRVIQDQATAARLERDYLRLTDSWVEGVTFQRAERQAMERGRRWESLMTRGLDDPLARKILAAGEPSFQALASSYPGKVLDRAIVGSYSDPGGKPGESDEEFVVWWNGAVSANLLRGRLSGATRPVAHNTNFLFRVGPGAEMFGRSGEQFSRIGYEDGWLPIVTAAYELEGVLYRQTVLAHNPAAESRAGDIAYVRFDLAADSDRARDAELHADVILIDGPRSRLEGQRLLDSSGAVLAAFSGPEGRFDDARQRLTFRFRLQPDQTTSVFFKIPYWPDSAGLLRDAGQRDFESARRDVRDFWTALLARGTRVEVPEPRVNDVWRALLAQNFILADGGRFTYGAALRYHDSYYPQESGFGAHTFAMFGFPDYAGALLPYCVPVSVNRRQAGRKYQNRRAMPLHHLLENYRLTGGIGLFERYKDELFRVAEEILADRRSTMVEGNGARPLHWGFLPPDRPGVDLRASTQTVYVTAHNIVNCQGLRDFGQFLVETGLDPARGRSYIDEAGQFRQTILAALERSAIRLPERPPFVDLQTLYFRDTPEYGPEPYDDLALGRLQGTYYHYWADMVFQYNFFNPEDRAGQWIADYVATRGGFVLGSTRGRRRPDQPYGWINNVYNAGYYNYRLRSGQVNEFLLGFYSRLAFGMSRHAYAASEGSPFVGYNTREGGRIRANDTFPNSAANAETLSMLRLMLVMEELRDNVPTGDIFLARGVPRAWLEPGKRIEVAGAPTYFGPLSFHLESKLDQGLVTASIDPPRTREYRRLIVTVRHPRKAPIRRVTVNGVEHAEVDSGNGEIRLTRGPEKFRIQVFYDR